MRELLWEFMNLECHCTLDELTLDCQPLLAVSWYSEVFLIPFSSGYVDFGSSGVLNGTIYEEEWTKLVFMQPDIHHAMVQIRHSPSLSESFAMYRKTHL